MNLRPFFLSALILPASGFCLELQPWFSEVYEFHFHGKNSYRWFSTVQGGVPQLTSTFHADELYAGLEFSPSPEWCVDGDVQCAATTKMSFNIQSAAIQARYLWLDDIVGDPISLTTGGSIRFTWDAALHDFSCPSHSTADIEISLIFGKEFDLLKSWQMRIWGSAYLGQANQGSPWVRAIAALENCFVHKHIFTLSAYGSQGFGRHTHVNTKHFNGYAHIHQQSIDVGIKYSYHMEIWGTFQFEYQRRVDAQACPQNVNTFVCGYLFPFSF